MSRADLVVPAAAVAGLRVPAVAVTNGAAEVDWVELPVSRWRFGLGPGLRMPLDPESAQLARRFRRMSPWMLVAGLAPLVAILAALLDLAPADLVFPIAVVALALRWWWATPRVGGTLPAQTPTRIRDGALRIRAVPVEVAAQWAEQNPGVTVTNTSS